MEILSEETQVQEPVSLTNIAGISMRNRQNREIFSDPILRKLVTNRTDNITVDLYTGTPHSKGFRGVNAFNMLLASDTAEFCAKFKTGDIAVDNYISTLRFLSSELHEFAHKAVWFEMRKKAIYDAIQELEAEWQVAIQNVNKSIERELAQAQIQQLKDSLNPPAGELANIEACLTINENLTDVQSLLGVLPDFKPEHFVKGKAFIRGGVVGYVQIMFNPDVECEASTSDNAYSSLPSRIYIIVFNKMSEHYDKLTRRSNEINESIKNKITTKMKARSQVFTVLNNGSHYGYFRKMKQFVSVETADTVFDEWIDIMKEIVDTIIEVTSSISDSDINISNMVNRRQVEERLEQISSDEMFEIIQKHMVTKDNPQS